MLYALNSYSAICQLYLINLEKNHSGMCVNRTNFDSNFRISFKNFFKENVAMTEGHVNATYYS